LLVLEASLRSILLKNCNLFVRIIGPTVHLLSNSF
jgi:hypothetical protein